MWWMRRKEVLSSAMPAWKLKGGYGTIPLIVRRLELGNHAPEDRCLYHIYIYIYICIA